LITNYSLSVGKFSLFDIFKSFSWTVRTAWTQWASHHISSKYLEL
jgi:hypothetical protein